MLARQRGTLSACRPLVGSSPACIVCTLIKGLCSQVLLESLFSAFLLGVLYFKLSQPALAWGTAHPADLGNLSSDKGLGSGPEMPDFTTPVTSPLPLTPPTLPASFAGCAREGTEGCSE